MEAKSKPCKRCKAEIPAERVAAIRGVSLCAKCSEEVGGEFKLSFTEENIAKAGSLKRNYGGVNITKRRKSPEQLGQ